MQALPWSFGFLADAAWREEIQNDAAEADLLVIGIGYSRSLPAGVEECVGRLVRNRESKAMAVIVLGCGDDSSDGMRADEMQRLRTLARNAGLEFFSPGIHGGPTRSYDLRERIHERAAAMTPVLSEILKHADASPRPTEIYRQRDFAWLE
jgi:hypothetical protein